MRWQHCIDHADKQTKAVNVARLSSRRSSAADRQSVKGDYTQNCVRKTIVLSMDPDIVPADPVRFLSKLTFDMMLQLASLGLMIACFWDLICQSVL